MREFLITAPACFTAGVLVAAFWNSKIWPWIKGTSKAEVTKVETQIKAKL